VTVPLSGVDRSSVVGGGGDFAVYEIMCAKSLTAGVQGPLKGPGSSGVLDAIWCNLSLVLEHFCTKFVTNISEFLFVLSMGDESITLRKLCHSVRPGSRARLRALEAQGF